MSTDLLPVHERFLSFQGEGCHMGRKAAFIRLFGCPVHCPWCDSAGTWHPAHVPERIERLSAEFLAEEAARESPDFVVITGGEPAIHNLEPLCEHLHKAGMPVHLETSGSFRIRGTPDWITLSPKRWKPPLPEVVERASEFKLIIDEPAELSRWTAPLSLGTRGKPVWIHPEWSMARNPEILRLIAAHISQHGFPFRAGWQIHKCFGVE